MPMEEGFSERYSKPEINRSYFISDALIYLQSYNGNTIDLAAKRLTDNEVAAFHRVVAFLNLAKGQLDA